jgi:hypothetical protein
MVCPTLCILILSLIQLLLLFGINVHENSSSMLEQWRSEPYANAKDKNLQRKLRSLSCIRWYADFTGDFDYNFFLIQSTLKGDFYSVIFDKTIDVVLLFPPSAFESICIVFE